MRLLPANHYYDASLQGAPKYLWDRAVSINWGGPNIGPKILLCLVWGPPRKREYVILNPWIPTQKYERTVSEKLH